MAERLIRHDAKYNIFFRGQKCTLFTEEVRKIRRSVFWPAVGPALSLQQGNSVRLGRAHICITTRQAYYPSALSIGAVARAGETELALGPCDFAPELPVDPRVKSLLSHFQCHSRCCPCLVCLLRETDKHQHLEIISFSIPSFPSFRYNSGNLFSF